MFFYPSESGREIGRSRNSERWFSQTKSHCVGEVPDAAYAFSFIVFLSDVSALEAYHRELLRVSVGGSEVCCRLDTQQLYHESPVSKSVQLCECL